MRVYGNLMNRIAEGAPNPEPKVGDGVTIYYWSDRHAGTIIAVKSPKSIVVQSDLEVRVDTNGPFTESQTYRYEQNQNGPTQTFTKRKNGRWVAAGEGMRSGTMLTIGTRCAYRDPSF